MECYLTIHTFPLEYFIEAERIILRLRFISNCFPSKDIVLISNLFLNNSDENISLRASILGDMYNFNFSNFEKKNSGSEFSKMSYKTVEITRKNESVEMNTFGDNNMIIKIILTDIETDNYQLMKTLVSCGNLNKNILCNEYDFFNPV